MFVLQELEWEYWNVAFHVQHVERTTASRSSAGSARCIVPNGVVYGYVPVGDYSVFGP